MPENETTETQEGETQETTTPVETRREKFERERLSRRTALKKMGVTTAMSVFALFSVDDLAHMVGKAMKQRAGDNQIAEVVARELKQAGVAIAATPSSSTCQHCDNELFNEDCWCTSMYGPYGPYASPDKLSRCSFTAQNNHSACESNCTGNSNGSGGSGGSAGPGGACVTYTQPPGWSG